MHLLQYLVILFENTHNRSLLVHVSNSITLTDKTFDFYNVLVRLCNVLRLINALEVV